jgi:predicted SpoU family rRNA methylase
MPSDLNPGRDHMKTKRITTNVMLDAKAFEALRKTAEADARSVSSLVRLIIANWYAERAPQQQRRREKRPEASASAA